MTWMPYLSSLHPLYEIKQVGCRRGKWQISSGDYHNRRRGEFLFHRNRGKMPRMGAKSFHCTGAIASRSLCDRHVMSVSAEWLRSASFGGGRPYRSNSIPRLRADADPTRIDLAALIRRSTGLDCDIEIVGVGPWAAHRLIAERHSRAACSWPATPATCIRRSAASA